MLQRETLAILRCPVDRLALALADESLVSQINNAIRKGQLRNRGGRTVERTMDGGLANSSGDLVYPIIDGIPLLVRDESIPLNQLAAARNE